MNQRSDELFMRRAFDLARLGSTGVAPNPMVGAVLVYHGRIIGEGYHRRHGGPHAEVEAVRAVSPTDRPLLRQATLYVSLEPCCVFGKTPPCTDLILQEGIPKVVISSVDRSPGVDGKGVEILQKAGVEVITGMLAKEGDELSATRNTFVTQERPYVTLKFAHSTDGFLGKPDRPVWLTNAFSQRLVHRWRSEHSAILVGTRTATIDNPQLSTRFFPGPSPLRIAVDLNGQIPEGAHLLDDRGPTWIIARKSPPRASHYKHTRWLLAQDRDDWWPLLLRELVDAGKSSLLVEGGAALLQYLIERGQWDEARVFVSSTHLGGGVPAPILPGLPDRMLRIGSDRLYLFHRAVHTR